MKNHSSAALFLDRDGIINIDTGYVHTKEAFHFNPGIFQLCQLFAKHHYRIFVVTNQSGIHRGYYTTESFHQLTQWIHRMFRKQGINIEQTYFCPHLPNEGCTCRKPAPGMVHQAQKEYNIDLKASWMIGDKQSDIDLATQAGIGHTIAIAAHPLEGAQYQFETIEKCVDFLKKHEDKLA